MRAAALLLPIFLAASSVAKPLQIAQSPLLNSRVALRASSASRTPAKKPVVGNVAALKQTSTAPVSGSAMPFVKIDAMNQTLVAEPAALQALAALPAPVCVMSMAGTARDGKSTFLNMYSQWLTSTWATDGKHGAGFNVGHDLDTCTDGAWIRLFHGRDGQPLPNTECSSVVLIDTQGLAKGSTVGVHRLFALSLLLSSTVSLNVMRQFNDDTLDKLGAATAHAMSLLPGTSSGEHSPNLVVLLRDARLRMAQSGYSISPDGMLHAALQPAADALDVTRKAIRSFFSNHSMVQMKQPDSDDLKQLETLGFPKRNRPFHNSFVAAAEHLSTSLQPKIVNNALLSGEMLASTARALVEQLNQDAQLSLSSIVDSLLHSQASEAVAAAERAFKEHLPPAVRRVGVADAPLRAAAVALSPATIELKLRNATQAAVAHFAEHAPNMGSTERLQPYIDQLRISVQAMQRELKQAHERALRLSAVLASRAQLRDENEAQREFILMLLEKQETCKQFSLQELLGDVAVVALGASAALLTPTLLTPSLVTWMGPLVSNMPIALSALGVWRVAKRSVRKVVGFALTAVKDLLPSANSSKSHFGSVGTGDPVTPAFG
ncbi:hypothetical protein AB1Y20_018134 [Prymnesium parvum]|uniref:Guanylate-binding protein N-terminal domain-containing protein n=1 Tax=Prymnesium parvum TaxID=97485 RepID=A0AB34JQT3_PRYPA